MKEGTAPPAPAGSKLALAVLVGLVVLSPWPFGSAHLRTTQAVALVSLATALGAFLRDGWRGQLQLPPRVLLWPLAGLWALAVFQLLPLPQELHRWIAPGSAAVWHPDAPAAAAVLGPGPHPISLYPEATRRWLAFVTGVVALALASAPALRKRRHLVRASVAIVSGAVLLALYGFVARLVFGNKLYGVWSVPTVAPFGPFVSKNHFAGYVELAALLAVGLAAGLADEARHGPGWLSWIESRRSKWVVVAWGAAFVLVLAVPVSLSRGGVVSLCAGLLAFTVLRLWARGPSRLSPRALAAAFAVALLAVGAITALLPTEARARVLTLAGVTSEQSGSYRVAVWRDTLRLVASSPVVGSGFGAYADALPRLKTAAADLGIEHAENDHLEALAEGGLVGACLMVALAGFVLLCGVRVTRTEPHRLAHGVAAGALAGVIALVVHSAFDFNLRLPSNALVFVALVAVVLASTTDSVTAPPARLLALVVVGASLATALLTPWAESRLDTGLLVRAAPSAESSLRRANVDVDLVAHLRRRPADATTWLALAWLRAPASRADAASLGSWAVALDPTSPGVHEASDTLRGHDGPARR